MSQVLYRKYRPQKFSDVIGQDHIVKVLEGAIKLGNISHAYLFSGSRGTGKTSLARIFAREVGTSPDDLVEMDAASNRGIDDVRSIRDSVSSLPFRSQYKVYIIDEVHMLTKDAWNAFLKTLEEPPKHVIFILATTELEKVPDTVISRCQAFQFRQPNQAILKDFALAIAKKEDTKIDPEAAELVALLGDGSFRDTQGIVQKILAYSKNKTISEEEVRLVTGAPAIELVHNIVLSITEKNLPLGLETVKKAVSQNIDMSVFLKLILHTTRIILLVRLGAEATVRGDLSDNEFSFVSGLAKADGAISGAILVELLTAYERTSGAYIASLPLELALININDKML